MRRIRGRKRSLPFSAFSPFGFYGNVMQASLQAASLISASSEVILHRGKMMNQALNGELPLGHAEFTRMWQEKMVAGGAFMTEALAQWSKGGMGFPFMPVSLPDVMKLLAPYEKKAAANARRLRKAKA